MINEEDCVTFMRVLTILPRSPCGNNQERRGRSVSRTNANFVITRYSEAIIERITSEKLTNETTRRRLYRANKPLNFLEFFYLSRLTELTLLIDNRLEERSQKKIK